MLIDCATPSASTGVQSRPAPGARLALRQAAPGPYVHRSPLDGRPRTPVPLSARLRVVRRTSRALALAVGARRSTRASAAVGASRTPRSRPTRTRDRVAQRRRVSRSTCSARSGEPGDARRTALVPPTADARSHAADADENPADRRRLPGGSRHTPLDAARPRGSSRPYAASLAPDAARRARFHRRQRAEPEPVLDAAVRPGAARRRRARLRSAARRRPTTRSSGRLAEDQRDRRRSLPARRRRSERGRARRTRRRSSSRTSARAYRASGRTTPIMDMFAIHPYGETSRTPPTAAHPHSTTHRDRRLPEARRSCSRRVRRDGAAGLEAADPLRRVRRPDADPGRASSAPTRTSTRPATDAVDASDAGRLLRAGDPARVLPADRRADLLFFHVTDEPTTLDRLGSRGLYYADDTPKREPATAGSPEPRPSRKPKQERR